MEQLNIHDMDTLEDLGDLVHNLLRTDGDVMSDLKKRAHEFLKNHDNFPDQWDLKAPQADLMMPILKAIHEKLGILTDIVTRTDDPYSMNPMDIFGRFASIRGDLEKKYVVKMPHILREIDCPQVKWRLPVNRRTHFECNHCSEYIESMFGRCYLYNLRNVDHRTARYADITISNAVNFRNPFGRRLDGSMLDIKTIEHQRLPIFGKIKHGFEEDIAFDCASRRVADSTQYMAFVCDYPELTEELQRLYLRGDDMVDFSHSEVEMFLGELVVLLPISTSKELDDAHLVVLDCAKKSVFAKREIDLQKDCDFGIPEYASKIARNTLCSIMEIRHPTRRSISYLDVLHFVIRMIEFTNMLEKCGYGTIACFILDMYWFELTRLRTNKIMISGLEYEHPYVWPNLCGCVDPPSRIPIPGHYPDNVFSEHRRVLIEYTQICIHTNLEAKREHLIGFVSSTRNFCQIVSSGPYYSRCFSSVTLEDIRNILSHHEKLLDRLVVEIFNFQLPLTYEPNRQPYDLTIIHKDAKDAKDADIYWWNIYRLYNFQDALRENPTEENGRIQRCIYPLPTRILTSNSLFQDRSQPDELFCLFYGLCLKAFIRLLLDLLELGIYLDGSLLDNISPISRAGDFYSLDLLRYARYARTEIIKNMDWEDEIRFYRIFMGRYDEFIAKNYTSTHKTNVLSVSEPGGSGLLKQERDADYGLLAHIMEYRISLLSRAISTQDGDSGLHQQKDFIIPIKDFWSRTLDIMSVGQTKNQWDGIDQSIIPKFYQELQNLKNANESANISMMCKFTHTNDTIANKKIYVSDILTTLAIYRLHEFSDFEETIRWCKQLSFNSTIPLIDERSTETTHSFTSLGVGFGTTCHAMELFWSCIADPEVGYIEYGTEYGRPTLLLTENESNINALAIACIVSVLHGVRGRLRLHPYFFLVPRDVLHMRHIFQLSWNPLYMLAFANTESALKMLDYHLEVLFHPKRTYYMDFADSYNGYMHYIKSHVAMEYESTSNEPLGDTKWHENFADTIWRFIQQCTNAKFRYGYEIDIATLTLFIASGGVLDEAPTIRIADVLKHIEYKIHTDIVTREIFENILKTYDVSKIRKFLHFVCGKGDVIRSENSIMVTFVQTDEPKLPQSSTCTKSLTMFYSGKTKSVLQSEMERSLDKVLEHSEYFGNL